MRFTKFVFKNFRGIKLGTLDLSAAPESAVHVLVGLNESGKTTVLEGIDHFRGNHDLTSTEPNWTWKNASYYQAMIPIAERANFNGAIRITASVEMEASDVARTSNFIKTTFDAVEAQFPDKFDIEQVMDFKDSKHQKTMNYWHLAFFSRKKRGQLKKLTPEQWLQVANFVELSLPKIMYFPAHLLELPDEIPLEAWEVEEKVRHRTVNNQAFYFQVLEDVFRATDPKLSIETHVLNRFRSEKQEDRQNLDAVLLRAETHLTRTILRDWEEIFGQPLRGKTFRLSLSERDGICSVSVKLVESSGQYSLNERSAGFRWFFAFVLLVRYRVHRNDRVLFLFDEPAASLHPRAQAQLLKAFSSLSARHQFVYSTHSHYLVNPAWLESTYVVKNDALELADDWDVSPEKSSISITTYRKFASSHPNQTFYYRPIMDALDYSPAALGPEAAGVLVEGKTDYYCVEYFKQVFFGDVVSVNFFPGGGAGSLDPLISLLGGWGQDFIVLLDADDEGRTQRQRYEDKFESVVKGKLFYLSDFTDSSRKIKGIESLFAEEDMVVLKEMFAPTQKTLSKKVLHRGIQELLATKTQPDFSKHTIQNFRSLLTNIQSRFDAVALF